MSKTAEQKAADEAAEQQDANNAATPAEQWAVFCRADGSQYLVCVADVSAMPEDQRPRTEPENIDDVRMVGTLTP